MWQRLGSSVIKYRLILLITLFAVTGIMGYFASKVKLSYDFGKAIPTDNPKYRDYVSFRQKFGDDGNVLVLAVKTDKFFNLDYFNAYIAMQEQIRKVHNVNSIISVPAAINLVKDSVTQKLNAVKIFRENIAIQASLDSAKNIFLQLPFYTGRLYNPDSSCYLMGVGINKDSLNSPLRSKIVADILACVTAFETKTGTETYRSGLPPDTYHQQRQDRKRNAFLFVWFGNTKCIDPVPVLPFFQHYYFIIAGGVDGGGLERGHFVFVWL